MLMDSWQYIALLGAVIVVAALLLPKGKGNSNSASSAAQIEQLELAFEQFMENMESEHEELVQMLTSSLQKLREEERVKSEMMARLEKRNEQAEEQLAKLQQQCAALEAKLQLLSLSPNSIVKHGEGSSQQEIASNVATAAKVELPENSIHKRYAELFEMYHAGKSIETIAKKLGKNKGEVQLILQLAEQEEKAHYA